MTIMEGIAVTIALIVCAAVGWFARCAELRRLERQLDLTNGALYKQLRHQARMERVDRGLAEAEERAEEVDPMPADIFRLTRVFPSGGSQLRGAAMRLRQDGASWEAIKEYIEAEIERQSPGLLQRLGFSEKD